MQETKATYQKLLALQNNLFDLEDYDQITDFIVNDSYKILPYQIAVIFEYNNHQKQELRIVDISGTINQEINSEFKKWLETILEKIVEDKDISEKLNNSPNLTVIHEEDIDTGITKNWAENLGQEILLAKLYANKKANICLILFNDVRYQVTDVINFNFMVKSYEQALKINLKNKFKIKNRLIKPSIIIKLLIVIFIISMFIPVTPSVMAPAEVISEKTWSVNAPINGIIKEIYIEPNSMVKKDQLLFMFDQLDLSNNLKVIQQELKILQTDQAQARALGFDDREERAKIYRLKQDIEAKKQEIQYANEQLNLSFVKSPEKGIILYKSQDDLIGKPVKVGETIMQIADIETRVIEIWLDVNDSLQLKKDMVVYYYSNKEPFLAIEANLDYYSYEAYITPQDKIAYRLLAKVAGGNESLIVGDHGQIKIYGLKKVALGAFLFQKPISKLRQWFYKVV